MIRFIFLIFLTIMVNEINSLCPPVKKWPIERRTLHYPELDEIANLLGKKLKHHFKHVESDVVDCPDLRREPFNMASEGMNGSARFLDIGHLTYILPRPHFNKMYSLSDMMSIAELNTAFAFGAGAGPYRQLGYNSEGFYNFNVRNCTLENHSTSIKLRTTDGNPDKELINLNNTHLDVGFLATLFASKGEPGKVVRLRLQHRIDEKFILGTDLRHILLKHFGIHKPIAVGLIGLLKNGSASATVMPDFKPHASVDDFWKWLYHYKADAPLVLVGTLPPEIKGLSLYTPHIHFRGENQGGHFVNDITPNEVEYEIYLNLAEYIYAVDKPTSHLQ